MRKSCPSTATTIGCDTVDIPPPVRSGRSPDAPNDVALLPVSTLPPRTAHPRAVEIPKSGGTGISGAPPSRTAWSRQDGPDRLRRATNRHIATYGALTHRRCDGTAFPDRTGIVLPRDQR